jgi:polyphosphate kinase 2 (PPK2 family)
MSSLAHVDLSLALSPAEGARRLETAQRRLLSLRLQLAGLIGDGPPGPPLCLLFEGWDASGKGGAIRRITAPLDPRHVHVASFAAPSEDERRHHFLWRFWPVIPGRGGMTILDRSWYGRVLVERVEQLIDEPAWRRAYEEIVAFERMLIDEEVILVKFWMQVSEDEQRRRFHAREHDPLKRWKLTDEDWRNLGKRPAYEKALTDMFRHTDHRSAPWHPIAAESKAYARVAVLEVVIESIEAALRRAGQEPMELGSDR